MTERDIKGIRLLSFDALENLASADAGCENRAEEPVFSVKHAFTTRIGGASCGQYDSFNFSYNLGDDPAHVHRNYELIAEVFGSDIDHIVTSAQTHTTNVRKIGLQDLGKGASLPRDYSDVDAVMTDIPGIILCISYADCVPILIIDPVHRAIAGVHSGWRGTAADIVHVTLDRMVEEYGTDPSDCFAGIGPSICQKCYEVGEDVREAFTEKYGEASAELLAPNARGRWQLDLWEANRLNLLAAGVRSERISVTDFCTAERPDLFFSHRKMGKNRGVLSAFIMIEE